MAQIAVKNLTFAYEGSFDNIFEHVSFSVDTDWKLGFLGRNGKGKTTFLQLLQGVYEYAGEIRTGMAFDYFPYPAGPGQLTQCGAELAEAWKVDGESWRVLREMEKLKVEAEVLYRPFGTLSPGERTKVMLAVLFSGEHDFLLIDEPTNHLDQASREAVKEYLSEKKGFLLVSHDRDLLDACVDHVLVLNRKTIEVQAGNFSSWWENKSRRDAFARMENEKHLKEIRRLRAASDRSRQWADKSERRKIGADPVKDPNYVGKRPYIGMKTKKMQSRVKQMERRLDREIQEKEGLLEDIEQAADLKLMPLTHHKNCLIRAKEYGLSYEGAEKWVFEGLDFTVCRGERVFLNGENGCGKSSLLKSVMAGLSGDREEAFRKAKLQERGSLEVASGLAVSFVSQDTSFLRGSLRNFCQERYLEEHLFCAILRQLDLGREQFEKSMEAYSEGQKKKVLLAASLLTPAHLYVWDEPLNYIDVFSRMQIEKVLLSVQPTMLVVEHDVRFRETVGTKVVEMEN
ncbi:MAG: ABC-F family ATP-binding cassette domain-containing protein [Lachnospiraceae bacterium]|nr:ABC-F family ATP-binding cassette domain-containing protein [Lachnospiraceae bacterium]